MGLESVGVNVEADIKGVKKYKNIKRSVRRYNVLVLGNIMQF